MISLLFKAKKPVNVTGYARSSKTGKIIQVHPYQSMRVTAEQVAGATTVQSIHALADLRKIPWDNNTAFMAMTKRVTGKEHLDDCTPEELQAIAKEISQLPTAPGLVDYHRMVADLQKPIPGRAYSGFAEALLKNGRAFQTAPLPKGVKPGHQGMCYMDAFQLADRRPDLTYVEGHVTTFDVPIEHAWTVDQNGTVVDPTLGRRATAKDWASREYFGIPFNIDYVRDTIMARKIYGVFYNPEQQFPILREGLTNEEMRQDLGGEMTKAHVAQHTRIEPSGKVSIVHDYQRRDHLVSPQAIIDQPSSAYVKAQPEAKETQLTYRMPDGSYTAQRQMLHNAILAEALMGKSPTDKPVVYYMGGGPASGKTTFVNSGISDMPKDAVMIAADEFKLKLPEYREGVAVKNFAVSGAVHEESADIANRLMGICGANGYTAIVDGIGDSGIERLSQKVKNLRASGQRVIGHYVTVPVNVALDRAIDRELTTGRGISPAVITDAHRAVSRVFPLAVSHGVFDHVTLWDTSNSGQAIKIAEAHGTELTIHQHALYDAFIAKGEADVTGQSAYSNYEGGHAGAAALHRHGGGAGVSSASGAGSRADESQGRDRGPAARDLAKALDGRMEFQGLQLSIENARGSTRSGVGPDGVPWSVTMTFPYGYIRKTEGVDGDHVDCFIGDNPDAEQAYVIHALKSPHYTEYDEDKVMLGFDSAEHALMAFLENYSDTRFYGGMHVMPMEEFKRKALATKDDPAMIKGT